MSNERWTLEAYLRSGQRPDLYLVDVNHPAGSHYFHNGLGIIEHGGNTYYGCKGLGSFTLGGSGGEVEITEDVFTLSGVDADILDMLDTSVKGGTVRVVHVQLRPDMTIDTEVEIETADMDYMTWTSDGATATIKLVCRGGFRELARRSTAHWDPEEQRNYLTGLGIDPDSDTGLDRISSMRNKLVVSQAA